jgi:type IV fimbrial biogenesis protein FimT
MCSQVKAKDGGKMTSHEKNEKYQLGATLVESMVVIAILGILTTVGIPSFKSMITKTRVASDLNEINSLMRFARFKAIEQENLVMLCPSSDYSVCSRDWNLPKIVFYDSNFNSERDPEEPLLKSTEGVEKTLRMSGRTSGIKFYESGITASPASITICTVDGEPIYSRQLTLSLQGKLKLSKDRNGDGIHESNSGTALSCEK